MITESDMSPRLQMEIGNDNHHLKSVSRKLIDALKERGVDEGTIFDIHVGFEEALRNAMIHGNKSRPDKKVKVEMDVTPDEVTIIIEDEGEGFDVNKVPDPTVGDNLLREGGRGVYLIMHLMDYVHYDKGGRRVTMRKYLKKEDRRRQACK